jgi:hypothetical protein
MMDIIKALVFDVFARRGGEGFRGTRRQARGVTARAFFA